MIKVKLHNDVCVPEQHGDWIDLKAADGVEYREGMFFMLNLGVSIEIPEGYEAHLVPRSSTFKKYHVIQTNSVGIIDNAYCGDEDIWKMPCYALKDGRIPEGARVAQFRILPKMNHKESEMKIVSTLGNANRGGFGSTGE